MTAYAAFLRAVNVGGAGKLPMAELRAMVAEIGGADAKTYIASGNVAFTHDEGPTSVRAALAARLEKYAGKPVRVFVRDLGQIESILSANPFPDAAPNRLVVLFLDTVPDDPSPRHQSDEQIAAGPGVLYIHYPSGQGRSRLSFPALADGTARNLNTLRKMRDILSELG